MSMHNENFSFTPLGGGCEIGANCYYMEWDDISFIIDAGAHPEKIGWLSMPSVHRVRKCDFILVSHAHQDHIGALPYLSKMFPDAPVFMDTHTFEIGYKMLNDSLKFIRRDISGIKMPPPWIYYDLEDLKKRIKTIECAFKYSKIEITPFDPGHILGSKGFVLRMNGKSVVFTSDISTDIKTTSSQLSLPDIKADLVICESTYGRDTETGKYGNRHDEIDQIVKVVKKTIEKGGSVLFPAFVIERAQEILIFLTEAIRKNIIPDIPVLISGLTVPISKIHFDHLGRKPKYEEIKNREFFYEIDDSIGPCIIVAGAGMMNANSTSAKVAELFLKIPNNSIIFTGYCSPRSSGFRLIDSAKNKKNKIFLNNSVRRIRNTNIFQFHLSCHAPGYELIRVIKHFSPDHIILMHGDNEAIHNLRSALEQMGMNDVRTPSNDETVQFGNKGPDLERALYELKEEVDFHLSNNDHKKALTIVHTILSSQPWDIDALRYLIRYSGKKDAKRRAAELFFMIIKKHVQNSFEDGNFEITKIFLKKISDIKPHYCKKISKKIKNIELQLR